jgi:hypothetical protein
VRGWGAGVPSGSSTLLTVLSSACARPNSDGTINGLVCRTFNGTNSVKHVLRRRDSVRPGGTSKMSATDLRERAVRYLAMAFNARENGEAEYADHLVMHASEMFGQAMALETPSPPSAERPVQQQQQPQPAGDKE